MWINAVYETTARDLVELYKFTSHRRAAGNLATIMLAKLDSEQLPDDCLVAPIPTASRRVRERGFDHAAVLAKVVAMCLDLPYAPILKRSNQTRQVGATRKQRLTQTADVYRVADAKRINNKHILLIDDIVTTGATIQSATKALRQAGAHSVDALVFAKKI